jgi:hypothetical protein
MFRFIQNYMPTFIGTGSIAGINVIDTLNHVGEGVKITVSITVGIATLVHLFIQIKNELKTRKKLK